MRIRGSPGVGRGRDTGQEPLAQPAPAGRQGRGGARYGTQTVMTWRPRRAGEGYVRTRCPRGGTQTVLTRRPGRGGPGYVSTRCPRGGTQAAMPRRARCGEGSLMTRCPRLGGVATVVGRHDGTCALLPGGARCSRKGLLLPPPNVGIYWVGVGRRQRGVGYSSPPGPLSNIWRGGGRRGGLRRARW